MQIKQTLLRLSFILLPLTGISQTTYFLPNTREAQFIDRMEIKLQNDSILNFSKTKPYSRMQIIPALERVPVTSLNKVETFNHRMTLGAGLEWTSTPFETASKPFLKHFYKTPATFFEVNEKDFYLALDPIFAYTVGKEKGNTEHIFQNTRGINLRGRIANKIGFSAYVTENQERDPQYVQALVGERQAVPGRGFYKDFKGTGYDFFDARGYISFKATRYIDIVFGYDRNFIGNGFRSLYLGDYNNNALFLKLNTRIWKFNYQNLFMELINKPRGVRADVLLPKKYATVHHLDFAVTKWLNVGLFEAVVFGRPDRFEFGYLNPVIFYRSVEQQNGSFDNALAGLDVKANLFGKAQLYGQLLLDEFKLSELKNNRGWWANKIGYQLGGKYIDAFSIPNLDLQAEYNIVRPFTYSHRDSTANYTHYNQPMAHVLGANFQEFLVQARYQPAPRWTIEARGFTYKRGLDIDSASYGANIFLPNVPPYRKDEYGYYTGSGLLNKVYYGSLLLSYEAFPNFFIDLNVVARKETRGITESNTTILYGGVRWNIARREFDF